MDELASITMVLSTKCFILLLSHYTLHWQYLNLDFKLMFCCSDYLWM